MVKFTWRVIGLLLLTLAIGVPSCQAVFPRTEAQPAAATPHAVTDR